MPAVLMAIAQPSRSPLFSGHLAQEPVFSGLLSMFMGSTLQEDIQEFARRLIEQGCNILGRVLPEQRNE